MTHNYPKKITLAVHTRRTKWAPFWAVLKKYGMGKARGIHPSRMTAQRRHWRRTKLKIKPRRQHKQQLG
jgi:ribosomal protein L39E